MMKHTRLTFSPLVVLLLSACSSNTLIKNSTITHNPEHRKDSTPTQQPLCVYKKEKGIAEVIAVHTHSYQFKFYLGDDIFEIEKHSVLSENELNIGDEFKAVKETTINKTARLDCPPVNFHLIL